MCTRQGQTLDYKRQMIESIIGRVEGGSCTLRAKSDIYDCLVFNQHRPTKMTDYSVLRRETRSFEHRMIKNWKSICSFFSQVVDYKANKRRKQERKKLAGLEKGPTHKDDITVWNDSIHIPNIPPTGLNRCRLIDVKYELEVPNSLCCKFISLHFGQISLRSVKIWVLAKKI